MNEHKLGQYIRTSQPLMFDKHLVYENEKKTSVKHLRDTNANVAVFESTCKLSSVGSCAVEYGSHANGKYSNDLKCI